MRLLVIFSKTKEDAHGLVPKGAESRNRRAIIFCNQYNSIVRNLIYGLEKCAGFQVHLLNLENLLFTLQKGKEKSFFSCTLVLKLIPFPVSLCGLISDEDWLMVFVIAPIKGYLVDGNAELAVKIEEELVPIQQITGLFVGSKCATYAEKPKVFFFLDLDAANNCDGPLSVRNKLFIYTL
jgi:hypothetical protein